MEIPNRYLFAFGRGAVWDRDAGYVDDFHLGHLQAPAIADEKLLLPSIILSSVEESFALSELLRCSDEDPCHAL